MPLKTVVVLPALLLAAAAAAAATDDELRRCRAVADAALRLACYDALPLAAARATPAAPAPAATGVPAPAAAPAPVVAAAAATGRFGFRSPSEENESISSHIPGRFGGWTRGTRLKLANGQVWQVIDGGAVDLAMQDPRVTVRRAALGSFLMEIEGTRRTPRVRRIE